MAGIVVVEKLCFILQCGSCLSSLRSGSTGTINNYGNSSCLWLLQAEDRTAEIQLVCRHINLPTCKVRAVSVRCEETGETGETDPPVIRAEEAVEPEWSPAWTMFSSSLPAGT